MADQPDPVDGLFVVPPDEFVAARNGLVKQFRAAGERDRAAEVAALRRPAVQDWALNVVAHRHARELEPFLDAAERSRQAQRAAASGHDGVDLRGALQGLRAASEDVVRAAVGAAKVSGRPTAALTAPISARLQEVAASAGLADQLRRGRLGTGDPEPDDLFDGDEPTSVRRPAARRPAPGRRARPASAASTPPAPDPKRVRQLENDVAAARRAHDKAQSAHQAAAEALGAADRAVAGAEDALERARARRTAASDACARAASALDDAGRALAEAEAGLDAEPPG